MKSPIAQLVLVVLLLAASIVGYLFWYQAVAADTAREGELAAQVAAAASQNARASASRTQAPALAGGLAQVNRYFLANVDVVPFLEALQSLGSTTGAQVSITSVGASPGSAATLLVTLQVEGPFNAVARTAGAIEYAPYDLSELSFTLAKEDSGSWRADLSLAVGTRSASASSTPASAAAPN